MKRILTALLLMSMVAGLHAQKRIEPGNYKVNVRGDIYYYHFHKDSLLTIVHGKDTSHAIWSADTTQSPMHFNMKVLGPNGDYLYTTPGIYEMTGKGRMRMRMSADMRTRPTGWLPRGSIDVITLIRIE